MGRSGPRLQASTENRYRDLAAFLPNWLSVDSEAHFTVRYTQVRGVFTFNERASLKLGEALQDRSLWDILREVPRC